MPRRKYRTQFTVSFTTVPPEMETRYVMALREMWEVVDAYVAKTKELSANPGNCIQGKCYANDANEERDLGMLGVEVYEQAEVI